MKFIKAIAYPQRESGKQPINILVPIESIGCFELAVGTQDQYRAKFKKEYNFGLDFNPSSIDALLSLKQIQEL